MTPIGIFSPSDSPQQNPLAVASTKLSGPKLWLARLAWVFILVLTLAVSWELLRRNYWQTWSEWQVGEARAAATSLLRFDTFVRLLTGLEVIGAAVSLLMGLVIAWKRPQDWMGLFVSATLILLAPLHLSSNMDVWRFPPPLHSLTLLLPLLRILSMGSILLFLFWVPDGRFVPKWARWPALAGLVAVTLFMLAVAGLGSGVLPPDQALEDLMWQVCMGLFLFAMGTAVVAQILRYHRVADPVQRQQMKWIMFGLCAIPGIFVIQLLMTYVLSSSQAALLGIILFQLTFLLIPVTIGVSILRYRLWDIDLVINRTVVFGTLTLLILLMYGLIVGGLALLLQTQVGPLIAVLATAAVALIALPLHQRVQQGVNRLMYGERDDPVALLSRLGHSLETAGSPDEILSSLVDTIGGALRVPYVAIALWEAESFRLLVEYGDRMGAGLDAWTPCSGSTTTGEQRLFRTVGPIASHLVNLPLIYQGQAVGQLLVAHRAPGERFSPIDQRLLANTARQAGAAVHAMQLTRDLRKSRERLVAAREEERRRIHRDLHDGLGPQLASLTLKIDAAHNLMTQDPVALDRILGELKRDTQAAIADIRRLVYDLRPATLDQLGLVGALQKEVEILAGPGGLDVRINAPETMPPLPAAVEVAAYRIIQESLTNAARHGRARQCAIWICPDDALRLVIEDDGAGLPNDLQSGVGITSMRERAEELGGTLDVESRVEGGTRVRAVLPLRSFG